MVQQPWHIQHSKTFRIIKHPPVFWAFSSPMHPHKQLASLLLWADQTFVCGSLVSLFCRPRCRYLHCWPTLMHCKETSAQPGRSSKPRHRRWAAGCMCIAAATCLGRVCCTFTPPRHSLQHPCYHQAPHNSPRCSAPLCVPSDAAQPTEADMAKLRFQLNDREEKLSIKETEVRARLHQTSACCVRHDTLLVDAEIPAKLKHSCVGKIKGHSWMHQRPATVRIVGLRHRLPTDEPAAPACAGVRLACHAGRVRGGHRHPRGGAPQHTRPGRRPAAHVVAHLQALAGVNISLLPCIHEYCTPAVREFFGG